MGSPPNANHGRINQRGKVHIGTIHAHHHVEVAHQHQFLRYATKHRRGVNTLRVARNHAVDDGIFVGPFAKEEHTTRRMFLRNHRYHLFEHLGRVNLLFVSGKRRNANPLLKSLFRTYLGRKKPQVAPLGWEDGSEIQLHWIAQLGKNVGIVLKSSGQGLHHLVGGSHQPLAFRTMFVDMFHPIASQIKPQSQVARPQHVVQVGYGRDILSHDALV